MAIADRSRGPAVSAGPTRFFGRGREREYLGELLRTHQVATVAGLGGVGKTRLVREVVATEIEPSIVRWVSLAEIDADSAVALAVADAIGRDSASVGPEQAVVEAFDEQELVVVLDNCESVLGGVVELVERVLASCRDARIIATSREPLGVPGEAVLSLRPFPLPAEVSGESALENEAIAMFVDRARLARWDFELGPENESGVTAICRRLDGLPLALELAAARVRSLSPAEIAARLDDRFALLRRPHRRDDGRHHTLEATVDWSYRLLDEAERRLFERMSVFAGSCDLEAATAVCAGDGVAAEDVLHLLDQLVDRSLIECADERGRTRYWMLETLRQYARDRLDDRGETEHLRSAHAEYYAELADRCRDTAERTWSDGWHSIASFSEFRAAALRSMHDDPSRERTLRLLAPLWSVAHSRHAAEIAELCDAAEASWPIEHDELGQAFLGVAAVTRFVVGDPDRAVELAQRAIAAEEGGAPRAVVARRALAVVTFGFRGDVEAGLARLDEVVSAAEAEGMRAIALEMAILRCQAIAAAGDIEGAIAEAERCRAAADELESPYMRPWSLYILGTLLASRDDVRAERCLTESLRLAREAAFPFTIAASLRQLGAIAVRSGRIADAAGYLGHAYAHFSRSGDRPQIWDVLRVAAILLAGVDRPDLAARVIAGAEADPRARMPAPLEAAALELLAAELKSEIVLASVAPPPVEELAPEVAAELRRIADEGDGDPEADSGSFRVAGPNACVFRREGDMWTLSFDGETVQLADLKGLHDIAKLVASPGDEIHCLELAGTPAARSGEPNVDADLNLQGDAGALLDDRAKDAYRRRIEELREQAELAEAAGDEAGGEQAREELDQLTDALSAALGLGGRARRAGDPAERARSAVGWRVRSALAKVEAVHPTLSRHLRNSIRMGVFCSYQPERPTEWQT